MSSLARAALLYTLTVFIVLVPTLANGFPFVMNDTWAYIASGMRWTMPWDRPAPYGLFLHVSSLGMSLWLSVIVQAALCVAVVRMAFKLLTPVLDLPVATLLTLAALTPTTGMSFNAGLLLPDFFAPLMFLCLTLVLVAPRSTTRLGDLVFLGVMFVLGSITHLAHLNAAVLMLLGAVLYRLIASRIRMPQLAWRRVALAAGLVATSWVTLPTIHKLVGGGFMVAPGSPAYLVARMAENGILRDFLKVACPHKGWKLCDQQKAIPEDTGDFLWGAGDLSPIQRNGGATPENLREYSEIFKATLKKPRWLARQLGEALLATARQLVLIDPVAVFYNYPIMDLVAVKIDLYFPGDHGEYIHSLQYKQWMSLKDWLPRLNFWTVILSIALLGAIVSLPELRAAARPPFLLAAVFVALSLVANAAICGGLSIPHDRYQARVVPLVPLLLALALGHPRVRSGLVRRVREMITA